MGRWLSIRKNRPDKATDVWPAEFKAADAKQVTATAFARSEAPPWIFPAFPRGPDQVHPPPEGIVCFERTMKGSSPKGTDVVIGSSLASKIHSQAISHQTTLRIAGSKQVAG